MPRSDAIVMSRPHRVDGPREDESPPSFVFSTAPIGRPVFSDLACRGGSAGSMSGVQIADTGRHLAEQSADRADQDDDDRADRQRDQWHVAQNVGGAKTDDSTGSADDRPAQRTLG